MHDEKKIEKIKIYKKKNQKKTLGNSDVNLLPLLRILDLFFTFIFQ